MTDADIYRQADKELVNCVDMTLREAFIIGAKWGIAMSVLGEIRQPSGIRLPSTKEIIFIKDEKGSSHN